MSLMSNVCVGHGALLRRRKSYGQASSKNGPGSILTAKMRLENEPGTFFPSTASAAADKRYSLGGTSMAMEVTRAPLEAPKRSSLPDLSAVFRRVTLNYILNAVFSGAGAKDDKARIFLQSYIRLVDKAIEEYELSRTNFEAFVSDKTNRSFGSLFRAIGHMENCFYSLARAIRFAAAMADHPEMAKYVSSLSVLQKSVRTRIEKMRNSIEHMDERVRNMKIKVGDLSALWLGEDYLGNR